MSHFAELDANDNVIRVIVAEQSFINSGAVGNPAKWVQTSYNGNIRKNYAGIGYKYDRQRDAFISPKPSGASKWVLNETTCKWEPPVPRPAKVEGKFHSWNDANGDWDLKDRP